MKPSWHYYEAHINLAPLDETNQSPAKLYTMLTSLGLKIVDLVNIDLGNLDSEEFGIITTMHSDNLHELIHTTGECVKALQQNGYTVWRYKVESTVVDSKYEDKLGLL